jgi:hypothetical protein
VANQTKPSVSSRRAWEGTVVNFDHGVVFRSIGDMTWLEPVPSEVPTALRVATWETVVVESTLRRPRWRISFDIPAGRWEWEDLVRGLLDVGRIPLDADLLRLSFHRLDGYAYFISERGPVAHG